MGLQELIQTALGLLLGLAAVTVGMARYYEKLRAMLSSDCLKENGRLRAVLSAKEEECDRLRVENVRLQTLLQFCQDRDKSGE